MAYVKGIMDGQPVWWKDHSWTSDSAAAEYMSKAAAERRVRITSANNRFLDRDERVEAYVTESI